MTVVTTRVSEGTTRNNGNVGSGAGAVAITRTSTIPASVYQTTVVVTNQAVVGGSTVTSFETLTTSTTASAQVTELVDSGTADKLGAGTTTAGAGSKGPPIGAIIGGVLGALALLALIAFFLFWKRRKSPERGMYSPAPRTMSQFLG